MLAGSSMLQKSFQSFVMWFFIDNIAKLFCLSCEVFIIGMFYLVWKTSFTFTPDPIWINQLN